MGTAAVAYIALLASRLPWFLGGAAPAAAGAGSWGEIEDPPPSENPRTSEYYGIEGFKENIIELWHGGVSERHACRELGHTCH